MASNTDVLQSMSTKKRDIVTDEIALTVKTSFAMAHNGMVAADTT